MVTSKDCLKKYGPPEREAAMVLWDVPDELELGVIPKRIYCNRDMVKPLEKAFNNIISGGFLNELRTWDGCFNIRTKRGGSTQSLHSWGIAVDINASWNKFGKKPTMHTGIVKAFESAGFDWGGHWDRPDGMHFQLSIL